MYKRKGICHRRPRVRTRTRAGHIAAPPNGPGDCEIPRVAIISCALGSSSPILRLHVFPRLTSVTMTLLSLSSKADFPTCPCRPPSPPGNPEVFPYTARPLPPPREWGHEVLDSEYSHVLSRLEVPPVAMVTTHVSGASFNRDPPHHLHDVKMTFAFASASAAVTTHDKMWPCARTLSAGPQFYSISAGR